MTPEQDLDVRSWLEREITAGRLSGEPTPEAKAGVARILVDALAATRPTTPAKLARATA